MATKILILILGISNLHAEKHNKGEHYDSILECYEFSTTDSLAPLWSAVKWTGVWCSLKVNEIYILKEFKIIWFYDISKYWFWVIIMTNMTLTSLPHRYHDSYDINDNNTTSFREAQRQQQCCCDLGGGVELLLIGPRCPTTAALPSLGAAVAVARG